MATAVARRVSVSEPFPELKTLAPLERISLTGTDKDLAVALGTETMTERVAFYALNSGNPVKLRMVLNEKPPLSKDPKYNLLNAAFRSVQQLTLPTVQDIIKILSENKEKNGQEVLVVDEDSLLLVCATKSRDLVDQVLKLQPRLTQEKAIGALRAAVENQLERYSLWRLVTYINLGIDAILEEMKKNKQKAKQLALDLTFAGWEPALPQILQFLELFKGKIPEDCWLEPLEAMLKVAKVEIPKETADAFVAVLPPFPDGGNAEQQGSLRYLYRLLYPKS